MAKKVKTILKLTLPAGSATPAPPVGPALGQHGLPIMEFVKEFNDRTKDQKGTILPAVITVYDDRTYTFIVKKPPAAELIRKKLGIDKGSETPGKASAGTLSDTQLTEIAQIKMEDLNTDDINMAKKIIAGTARAMGVQIK
ncbi:50S ribosomal protein L11 [Candidatus Roizmanbacteria bacterium CG22_combo_CG10-13_8_21_14_all_38_20]|uniref:Large ribosomal subunit protein uL11 n=1 Tax=Candidatus Roizmanbacteria bacterium CG22_combo_CG10-13_8_21_14_all_38_20 TaxID=1974862 RepID=A0A2H0BV04_9BACT|nr:50S ribosomal protein L11 [Candidatus Microgenomates bacterium]PIP61461.1 MAG: 50S ribosomal protein L11 [Candidatus Roizmanbacteria bacterium CG22_combo_CG10-13_8_21_14_all_38_20]PJC30688.1 MAG: 50S ribosomal protein L11 [Candidatus Roizmanbacteria bacterium CG_4_9_14_0_2_um_filter_38_17]